MTNQKAVGFYIRAAMSFLKGTEEKPPVDQLELSALGNAINSVIAVAGRMKKEDIAVIKSIETNYADVQSGGATRGCPQIKVLLVRKK
jgi:hypothetical protein